MRLCDKLRTLRFTKHPMWFGLRFSAKRLDDKSTSSKVRAYSHKLRGKVLKYESAQISRLVFCVVHSWCGVIGLGSRKSVFNWEKLHVRNRYEWTQSHMQYDGQSISIRIMSPPLRIVENVIRLIISGTGIISIYCVYFYL